jgi:4-amino-4-deoxy-L-arabinose transferase-like glycosyltransferase
VCLFIIFVIAPLTGISKHFGNDHDGYIQLAENLGRGNGYVFEEAGPLVFHRPPLYPFLLVPITFLPDFLQRPALVLVQSVMVGCIGGLIFQIARRLFNPSTAGAAVAIFLLNPWVYWDAKNPMTVILQGLLYTLLTVLVGSEFLATIGRYSAPAGKMKLWSKRLATGIVAAALVLTHGAMLAVNIVLLFVLFTAGIIRHNYQAIKTSIIAAAVMVTLVAPWTYRNWVEFHRFIPVAGGSGLAYFNGNVHWGGIMQEPQRKGEGYITASLRVAGIEGTEAAHTHWKGLKDIELEDRINKKMIEDVCTHPGAFMKKVLLNSIEYYFPMLMYPYLAVKHFNVQKLVITIFHLGLWILALMGIWRDKKEERLWLPVGLMLAAIALYAIWFFPFATFIGHSLYTFGTIPFLSILAAKGLGVQKAVN